MDGNGAAIDLGLALFFQAPNTFTGEDVLELQGHGGSVVLDCVLARTIELGARLARPGEFSERAFLNNKMDLAQAEAVASLVNAQSTAAAKAAVRSLQGDFSKTIHALTEELIQLRQYVEAAIDFSDEEIDFIAEGKISDALQALQTKASLILKQVSQGALLADGAKVVIAGKANVGKSSLLNQLAGDDTAIVTAIPGTTRDLLKTNILLDGIKLELIDTAGIRETNDIVEQEGVRRARAAITAADLVMLVVDSAISPSSTWLESLFSELVPDEMPEAKVIVVTNKIDLRAESPEVKEFAWGVVVLLSAKTGAGLDLLRSAIKKAIGVDSNCGENIFIARRRHLVAIEQAIACVERGLVCMQSGNGCELLAEELRLAQQALGEITGEISTDELLGRIFSEFCIGK